MLLAGHPTIIVSRLLNRSRWLNCVLIGSCVELQALELHMEFGTTVSTCNATVVQDSHIFVVNDYSVIKETGPGNFMRSPAFQVGEYDCSVRFYPQGINAESQKHISILVELMRENAEVKAIFCYRLISPGGQSTELNQIGVLNLSSAEGKCRMEGCGTR